MLRFTYQERDDRKLETGYLANQAGKSEATKNWLRLRWKLIYRHWEYYLLILLPVAYIIIFHYIPMAGIILAFKDYWIKLGIWGSPWSGLRHIITFLSSPNFPVLIKNTLGISLYSLIAGFPVPIILALSLNEVTSARFKKLVQTVTYVPHFISTVVLVGMLMQFLDPKSGFINNLINLFGGESVNFMANPDLFKSIIPRLTYFKFIWNIKGVVGMSKLISKPEYEKQTAQTRDKRIFWWREARFGMFIHFGLYSQVGRGEWLMSMENRPIHEYEKLADHFIPKPGAPREWAALAKKAGMKYMVLTTRHHEGFSLWNSKVNPYNSVNYGPKRDIVREYVDACREYGLKIGFYSSQMDWHHPDGWRCAFDTLARSRFTAYIKELNREILT